jgi:type 1 glutamine amidotransferase
LNIKRKNSGLLCIALMIFVSGCLDTATSRNSSKSDQKVHALILSGANNHNWSETTPAIKDILTGAGISTDVTEQPSSLTFQQLSKYDVIVSNWNNFKDRSLDWPEETKQAFLDFISKGGGHVMVHAGGCSFYGWGEYHKIVASWGKQTNHGPKHEFAVNIELPDHPICRGVKSFQTNDELWRNTTFPAGSKVLMTGFSSKESGGSDTNEPVLAVSQYGSGRCVNFMLGHDASTMANHGFKTVLTQSVLWAAGVEMQTRNLKWIKTDKSVALTNNSKTVWQFNYGKGTSKPFFHPVSLVDGTVLTHDRPDDHPWHHGLWFSWKYINGVNFWEEDLKTGKSDGKTDWSNVKVVTQRDYSAKITMDLTYSHKGQKPILSEKRTMEISPPDKDGVYYIDWESKFKACSETGVKLDRTPLPDEPGGKAWGGYAGLSVRLNGEGEKWAVATGQGPIRCDKTFRGKSNSMDFSGVFDGKPAGIAILDNPKNLNAPSPWYAIAGNPMKYFSPAVLCYKPHTLGAGKAFTLNYRVVIHPQKWYSENLKSQINKYMTVSRQP